MEFLLLHLLAITRGAADSVLLNFLISMIYFKGQMKRPSGRFFQMYSCGIEKVPRIVGVEEKYGGDMLS